MDRKITGIKIVLLCFAMLAGLSPDSFGRDQYDHDFRKIPGFFGYTRGCMYDMDHFGLQQGGCVTNFLPSVMADSISAPVQTVINVIEAMEKGNSSDSSTKSSKESSSNKSQTKEVPEERKVLNRLSLFLQVADDAREYLKTDYASPLLLSASQAVEVQFDIKNDENRIKASEKILELEQHLLLALSHEESANE